jgi:outer membrane biosynthesis protein TonB
MWNESTSPVFLAMVAASILAHVTVLALLPPADAAVHEKPAPPMFVVIETAPAPSPPRPAAPPPPSAKELPPTVVARSVARSPRPVAQRVATRPTVATAEPRPSAAPELADFSGVTLTNEGGGWSTPVGDGSPIGGPIGPPAQAVVKSTRAAAPSRGGGTGDRVVAVGDLSRPPRAPNLDAQLAANYPGEARAAGIGGSAVIRARILVDGRVGTTRVVSESAPGFGKACQRTLAGSRWQPPLDANQQAVATDLAYTCTFAVAR